MSKVIRMAGVADTAALQTFLQGVVSAEVVEKHTDLYVLAEDDQDGLIGAMGLELIGERGLVHFRMDEEHGTFSQELIRLFLAFTSSLEAKGIALDAIYWKVERTPFLAKLGFSESWDRQVPQDVQDALCGQLEGVVLVKRYRESHVVAETAQARKMA